MIPAWTYSQLEKFETCPKQFYHVRVLRDVKEPPTEHTVWGERVHTALEERVRDGKSLPEGMEHWEGIASKIAALPGEKHCEVQMAVDKAFPVSGLLELGAAGFFVRSEVAIEAVAVAFGGVERVAGGFGFVDQAHGEQQAILIGGRMSQQRVPFDVRMEALSGLRDWWTDRIDASFFNQLCGYTVQNDTRYTGNNATVAPDTTVDEVVRLTGAPLTIDPGIKTMTFA